MTIRDLRILEVFQETCDPLAVKRRLGDLTDAIDDITTLCQRAKNITELRKHWPEFSEALKKMHDLAIELKPVTRSNLHANS